MKGPFDYLKEDAAFLRAEAESLHEPETQDEDEDEMIFAEAGRPAAGAGDSGLKKEKKEKP